MADLEITVNVEDVQPVTVNIQNQVDITVNVEAGVANNYVNEGDNFYLDGPDGDTYFTKNPTTGRVEGWRQGVKRFEF